MLLSLIQGSNKDLYEDLMIVLIKDLHLKCFYSPLNGAISMSLW